MSLAAAVSETVSTAKLVTRMRAGTMHSIQANHIPDHVPNFSSKAGKVHRYCLMLWRTALASRYLKAGQFLSIFADI